MNTSVDLKQLLEAGCHFGHQSRRWNPAMSKYIYSTRDKVHIFDLAKTKEGLEKACEFLRGVVKGGGTILFVGTKRQAKEIVTEAAKKAGMPYVTERWLGGMLTNFNQAGKSLRRLKDLKEQKERGELKKYTKKEQLLLDREIAKLERFFGGISQMARMPDAVFVVDTHKEEVAVKEANIMKIPVVGIVDTNGDPDLVDYVIPANDDAVKSIELVVNEITEAISK